MSAWGSPTSPGREGRPTLTRRGPRLGLGRGPRRDIPFASALGRRARVRRGPSWSGSAGSRSSAACSPWPSSSVWRSAGRCRCRSPATTRCWRTGWGDRGVLPAAAGDRPRGGGDLRLPPGRPGPGAVQGAGRLLGLPRGGVGHGGRGAALLRLHVRRGRLLHLPGVPSLRPAGHRFPWAPAVALAAAAYANFFTHHYLPDLRWLVALASWSCCGAAGSPSPSARAGTRCRSACRSC